MVGETVGDGLAVGETVGVAVGTSAPRTSNPPSTEGWIGSAGPTGFKMWASGDCITFIRWNGWRRSPMFLSLQATIGTRKDRNS